MPLFLLELADLALQTGKFTGLSTYQTRPYPGCGTCPHILTGKQSQTSKKKQVGILESIAEGLQQM
jgi:hypothetical protein